MNDTDTRAARIEALKEEIRTLDARLNAARRELIEAQCEGEPRYERGTVILVPRKLFGQIKWWPARIDGVHLSYSQGAYRDGTPWENKVVSYSVYLQQKDGSFGGSSEGYYHSEVQLAPAGTGEEA